VWNGLKGLGQWEAGGRVKAAGRGGGEAGGGKRGSIISSELLSKVAAHIG
jgi:hypothetical protein